jgi:predicted peptidase
MAAKSHFIPCLSLVLLIGATVRGEPAKTGEPGKQQKHTYVHKADTGSSPRTLGYHLYLPADYGKAEAKDKKWPVILFLHGAGERGDGKGDLDSVKEHGPPMLVEKKPDSPTTQFIVISPQCPKEQRWDVEALKGLLDEVVAGHKADRDRIYLTGLSMGGMGSWSMAAKYPDTFAAVAPICGGGNPASADRIKHLPFWVFHGDKDKAVPIQKSQEMVDALKQAGAKQVEFTVYSGVGHDSWVKAYNDPKLYEWFLSHKRGGAAANAGK